jgi:hypothetical protein
LPEADRGGVEPPDRIVGAAELHERVIDDRLGDGDRVRPVVAHGQLDHAGAQLRALDGQLLGGRAETRAEAGPAERGEQPDRGEDQHQRDDAQHPARHARQGPPSRSSSPRAAPASIRPRPRRSPASRAR